MASTYAVAVAAFLQIVLRISFFIEQSSDVCSTAPSLASWIFLIAYLDVLLDICIYPVRYMHLPYICQITVETIITVLLAEFGSLVVWCTIEKMTCKLCKYLLLLFGMSPKLYYAWECWILGIVTTSTSLIILVFVSQATDHFHFMHKRSLRMCRKINTKVMETCLKIRSLINTKHNNCEAENFDMESEIFCQPIRTTIKRNRCKKDRSRSRSRNRR